eukprot:g104.t1
MITLKITFGAETRRASIDVNTASYEVFLALLTRLFQTLPAKNQYTVVYEDDDHDMVTVSSNSELQDALRLAQTAGWTSLRMSIRPVSGGVAASARRPAGDNESKTNGADDGALPPRNKVPQASNGMLQIILNICATRPELQILLQKPNIQAALQRAFSNPDVLSNPEVMETTMKSLCEADPEFATFHAKVTDAMSAQNGPPAVHEGITCDRSGMSPIIGNRYKKQGANYDLCEAEFAKLSDSEKKDYVKIERPANGSSSMPFPPFGMGGMPMPPGGMSMGGHPEPMPSDLRVVIEKICERHPDLKAESQKEKIKNSLATIFSIENPDERDEVMETMLLDTEFKAFFDKVNAKIQQFMNMNGPGGAMGFPPGASAASNPMGFPPAGMMGRGLQGMNPQQMMQMMMQGGGGPPSGAMGFPPAGMMGFPPGVSAASNPMGFPPAGMMGGGAARNEPAANDANDDAGRGRPAVGGHGVSSRRNDGRGTARDEPTANDANDEDDAGWGRPAAIGTSCRADGNGTRPTSHGWHAKPRNDGANDENDAARKPTHRTI